MRIISDYGFGSKVERFGPKMNKDYRINTCNKAYFTIANNTNKNYSYLQFVQIYQYEDRNT
jgi:hypothetical protein